MRNERDDEWVNQIHEGDVRTVLDELPESSVHCAVTSPPYWGLRNHNHDDQIGLEATVAEYVEELVAVGRKLRRVLRDGGSWWLNLGDTYAGGGGVTGKPAAAADLHDDETYPEDPPARRTQFTRKTKLLVPHRVAIALIDDGWIVRSDAVWCLSATTKVYARTQKREGPMMVKDIARLDPETVELWNGTKWTSVVDFYKNPSPNGTRRLTLRSGEQIDCTDDHRWPTTDGRKQTAELSEGEVLREVELPEPATADRSQPDCLDDEDIGWFIGTYLADGSRGSSGEQIQIGGHRDAVERFERLQTIADAFHGTCHRYETSENGVTDNLYGTILTGIIDHYVHGTDTKSKGLTPRCWMRSDAFLDAVLHGYLSGDAHYDEPNGRWRLGFSRNDRLATDLRTICARLGYQFRLQRTTVDGFEAYSGEIREFVSDHPNVKDDTEIVAIEKSPCRSFYDIEVADEPHTFALASGVLTHNSKTNGMPSSVKDRLNETKEFVFHLTPKPDYWFDLDAIRTPHKANSIARDQYDYGSAGRQSMHCPREDREKDVTVANDKALHPRGANPGDVFEIGVARCSAAHYAIFPEALITPPIKAACPPHVCATCGTPYDRETETTYRNPGNRTTNGPKYTDRGHESPNYDQRLEAVHTPGEWTPQCECETDETEPGIVLDPFAGAGTTCKVAKRLGRRFVGIELNPEYVALAQQRAGIDVDEPDRLSENGQLGLAAFADGGDQQ